MLRMPQIQVARPKTVSEAVRAVTDGGDSVAILAGGTDLVPNLKHRIYDVDLLVSLDSVEGLRGIEVDSEGTLVIGSMTPLEDVAEAEHVRSYAPALAQATGLVAGPHHRRMGTMGGNVMLDTRCQWINQSYFWRKSLGFCLKKDGTLCHVVKGGKRCVAAASNDSAPALMTLQATLVFEGPKGRREVLIDELWRTDGIDNKKTETGEILVEVRIPAQARVEKSIEHRGAYGKLRDRGSIDFPLLGVAVRIDLDDSKAVTEADIVVVALQAVPRRVQGVTDELKGSVVGSEGFAEAVERVVVRAQKQCRPMPNIPGDAAYRQRMVPVYVRRTLLAAANGTGPVHHI